MKNPHIIVGAGRRCVCGMYGERSVGCAEVLEAVSKLPDTRDGQLIRAVVAPLIVDCDTPERTDEMTPELHAAIHDLAGFERYLVGK